MSQNSTVVTPVVPADPLKLWDEAAHRVYFFFRCASNPTEAIQGLLSESGCLLILYHQFTACKE